MCPEPLKVIVLLRIALRPPDGVRTAQALHGGDCVTVAHPTYDRIYDEAGALLHQHGVHFVFQELERRAGIGSGGLRHHFRDKAALVAVFASDEFESERRWAEGFLAHPDVGAALEGWFRRLAEWLPTTYGRSDLMVKAVRAADHALHPLGGELIAATDPLLERARSAGWLQVDVTTEEVVVAIVSAAALADALVGGPPPTTQLQRILVAKRYIQIFLMGLKASSGARKLKAHDVPQDGVV